MSEPTSNVRVRMAPSPTGAFHLGRSRSAVINWLFARHYGGTFVLRIEDTDQARSRPEHLDSILDSFGWLGMDWDEGPGVGGPHAPYFQMARLDTYPPYVERLLTNGHAYRCYCTAAELDEFRAQAQREKRAFRYPRICRNLSAEERQHKEALGLPSVVRLAVAESGRTGWQDLVLGATSVDNSEIDDFIIMRSDSSPTYNFVVVVDDLTMEITHVIRGQDHVPNTPKQILIYQYLGEPLPQFGHVPLVVGLDDQKISARHGAEAVGAWGREHGYLPDAVFNYLATVGIAYEDGREILSREELIRLFDLSKVSRSRARLDEDKIDWMNATYIRALPLEEFVRRSLPFLQMRDLVSTPPREDEIERVRAALRLEQERVHTLEETPEAVEFFLREALIYDPALLVPKKASVRDALAALEAAEQLVRSAREFSVDELDRCFRQKAEELGIKTSVLFGCTRVAITGRTAAPPLFDTMLVLGRDRVTSRLHEAGDKLRQVADHLE